MSESKVRSNRRFLWTMLVLAIAFQMITQVTDVAKNAHSFSAWFWAVAVALTALVVLQSIRQDARDTNAQFAPKKESE